MSNGISYIILGAYLCAIYPLPRSLHQFTGTGPMHAHSQWETTLHCYVVSHWLRAYTKWSLSDRPVYSFVVWLSASGQSAYVVATASAREGGRQNNAHPTTTNHSKVCAMCIVLVCSINAPALYRERFVIHNYTPRFNEVDWGVFWYHLVRLSVCPSARLSVCGQNRVRSVSSTILIGSISYLHILSSNLRRCVACNARFKI